MYLFANKTLVEPKIIKTNEFICGKFFIFFEKQQSYMLAKINPFSNNIMTNAVWSLILCKSEVYIEKKIALFIYRLLFNPFMSC